MNETGYLIFRDESNADLYHHGIKGQTWGIRRYQNEDGSLTPAGEKRYNDAEGMANRGFTTSSSDKRVNNANQAAAKAFSNSSYWKDVKKAEADLDRADIATNKIGQKLHNAQESSKENPNYWRAYNESTGEYEEAKGKDLDEKEQQRLEQLYQKKSAKSDKAYEVYDNAVKKTVTNRSLGSLMKEAAAYISAGSAFISAFLKGK